MAKKSQDLLHRIGDKPFKTTAKKPSKNPLLKRVGPISKGRTIRKAKTKVTTSTKNGKINPLLAALNRKNPQVAKQSIKIPGQPSKQGLVRNQTVLKIKNASTPKFLKINNLEYGTTSSDLSTVLSSIGAIEIIKVKDLPSGSATAEVLFKDSTLLEQAASRLNGAVADGRTIVAVITKDTELDLFSEDNTSSFNLNRSLLKNLVNQIEAKKVKTTKIIKPTSNGQTKQPIRPTKPKGYTKTKSLADRMKL